MIWLLIGFVCLLLVIGALFTGKPIKFAITGLVVTGALAFVGFIVIIIWAITSSK